MKNRPSQFSVTDLITENTLLINDGYRAKNSELNTNSGIPFARAGNINNGFQFDDADLFPKEEIERVGFKKSQPGDVLFTSKGTVGRFAYVSEDTPEFVYSPQLCFWRSHDTNKIFPKWLYYWMHSHEFFTQVKAVCSQSDMAEYVSLRDQRSFFINVPDISLQKAIAHILGTLDDKIELNRRTNKTLESIARAIFKSWFVDFDPVRAKRDGKTADLSLSPEILDLFPDSFQDSELGEIPVGWKVCAISEKTSKIQYGFTQSSTTENIGPRFLRITDIRGGSIDWSHVPYCETTEKDRDKYSIRDKDIFIARTGASTGENIYVVNPPDAVFASYLIRVQFDSDGLGRFAGEFFRSRSYFTYIANNLGGSAQPNANAQTLTGAKTTFPTDDLLDLYFSTVRPFDLARAQNDRESTILSEIRDTLLPKLISGELRIKDAEKFLKDAPL